METFLAVAKLDPKIPASRPFDIYLVDGKIEIVYWESDTSRGMEATLKQEKAITGTLQGLASER